MKKEKKFESALVVKKGVEQPPIFSSDVVSSHKKLKKKKYSAVEYFEGIRNGDITILSQAITLVESSLTKQYSIAQEIIQMCIPHSGKSVRIGITGVPGVGKSTFIEALGGIITGSGSKLAVLAIDPSSERSRGSILGDKTRMETLAVDKNAFIRPSPSAGSLGGVARKTRETIILCEAAGFDVIFVETVGVGQSEVAVHSMVDFFLLLMLAGAGDELQGIKRGIMEMADAIAITKADGNNIKKAGMAKAQYTSALHLFPIGESKWSPKVLTCSSVTKEGISEIWDTINEFIKITRKNSWFQKHRKEQSLYWMYETIAQQLRDSFYRSEEMNQMIREYEQKVMSDEMSSFEAARNLLEHYFTKKC
jgi:LAO/AO transport system kinase